MREKTGREDRETHKSLEEGGAQIKKSNSHVVCTECE